MKTLVEITLSFANSSEGARKLEKTFRKCHRGQQFKTVSFSRNGKQQEFHQCERPTGKQIFHAFLII
jgi:hypothetical protein